MPESRVSAELSSEDKAAIVEAFADIRTKMPFLLDLSTEDRKPLAKMGDKNYSFAYQSLEYAIQNPDMLPRSFNVEEMRKDLEIYDELHSVINLTKQLLHLLEGTAVQAGSEAITQALLVYKFANAAGSGNALQVVTNTLSQHFAKKPRNTQPKNQD